MAITVRIYLNKSDNRVVNKRLLSAKTYGDNVAFRDATELHQPVFTVSEQIDAECNYCSISGIDGLERFYFAEIVNLRTDLTVVRCDLDVLMTFKDSFDKISVIPTRSSSDWNDWMMDGNQPVEVAKYNYLMLPDAGSWGSGLNERGEWDYGNPSIIAAIVGNDDPTSVEVVQT